MIARARSLFGKACVAAITAAVALVPACRSGPETNATPGSVASTAVPPRGAVLTDDQASALSRVLFRNFEAGGATIDADIPFSKAARFVLHAEMDWTDPKGRGTLETIYSDGRPPEHQEVAWTTKQVGISSGGDMWQQRLLDPRQHPLDQILAIINSLAAQQRDNPVLIRQGPARYLGPDVVNGLPVDKFAYGERTIWYVDSRGELVRVEVSTPSSAGAVGIDIRAPGPRVVHLP